MKISIILGNTPTMKILADVRLQDHTTRKNNLKQTSKESCVYNSFP